MRLVVMLILIAIAGVPGWYAWQELAVVYNSLWEMRADYSIEKELYFRAHAIRCTLLSFVTALLVVIAFYVGSTPEERRRAEELRRQQLDQEVCDCVHLKPAPKEPTKRV